MDSSTVSHRETLYEQVPCGRRARWHLQIGWLGVGMVQAGARLLPSWQSDFVRGRDAARAVQYLRYAGEQAVRRLAHQEALPHLTRALELLAMLPRRRGSSRNSLPDHLGAGGDCCKGYTAGDGNAGSYYSRAREYYDGTA